MGKSQLTAEPGSHQILITREFDAPRQLIFRAWTEPQLVKQWLGPRRLEMIIDPDLIVQWLGPRKYEMIIDKYDVRDGGSYRYIHREPDGTEYGFHGVFHGDPSPDGMVQTFEFEGAPGHVSLDTLRMEERDGKTVVHINSVHHTVESRDATLASGMATGLEEGFQRLEEVLATMAPVGAAGA
jgi:uncharacterized protein YndB with AHSA1/START domain